MTLLTFVIPVRHPDNARDWPALKDNLAQTCRSVSGQLGDDWRGIVVANHGSDLPPLPERFSVHWVDFPANTAHERGGQALDQFYDAFRFDKGQRVLAGMLSARDSDYFMIVDDDDLVSSAILPFVAANRGAPGWIVDKGLIWNSNGSLMYQTATFDRQCGTCLIVRSDLYDLPATMAKADPQHFMAMLGSHHFIKDALRERGTPLAMLPFAGAVYRVGHRTSHSRTPGVLRNFVFKRGSWRRPADLLRNLSRLRWYTRARRDNFAG